MVLNLHIDLALGQSWLLFEGILRTNINLTLRTDSGSHGPFGSFIESEFVISTGPCVIFVGKSDIADWCDFLTLKMLYLSWISWGESLVMGFVTFYKCSNFVDVRRRRLLVGMLAVIEISFLSFAHTCLSSLIFFHTGNVIKWVTTTQYKLQKLLEFFIGESISFAERPLEFWRRAVYRVA